MAETVLALGYALFLLGVVLVITGRTRSGVRCVVLGVLLIVKTLALVALIQYAQQHWLEAGTAERHLWLLFAIPIAAVAGVALGALLVITTVFKAIRRVLAPPEARAALGGAVIGTIAAEALRARQQGGRR